MGPLPILNSPPTAHELHSMEGEFKNPCVTCPLNTVCVGGCCGKHDCEQKACHRECNSCGGGDLREVDKGTPAVCSKAPMRELYLDMVKKDHYEFTKRKLIKLKNRAIIVNQGSPGRVDRAPYPDDTEMVGVNLRHVWSAKGGWFSQDLKDYLRLPSTKTKLLLLTHTHDDVLERAWGADMHYQDPNEVGFDVWQSLEFSQYYHMSRFNNLWSGYRTLYAVEASKPHFASLTPHGMDLTKGEDAYGPWAECAKAIPQLMINWQYTTLSDVDGFRWMVSNLRRYLKRVPVKAIWFVGVVSPAVAYQLQYLFPNHTCYFLSVTPWLGAHKGTEFTLEGKTRKSPLLKKELVLKNQNNYATLINSAVSRALKQHAVANG